MTYHLQYPHFVAHRKRAHLLRLSLTIVLAAGCLFQLVLYLSPPEAHRISSLHHPPPIAHADADLLASLHSKLAEHTPTPTSSLNSTLAELIESRLVVDNSAADRTIILLWTPYSLRDFALNWLCHAREIGVTNYAFIVEEELMERYFNEIGEPVYMIPGMAEERIKRKMTVVGQILNAGYGVLLSDITTAWLANPFPYFASTFHLLTDIMGYQDRNLDTAPYLSTSLLYLRPTPSTLSLWSTFTQALELDSLHHIPAPRLLNLLLSYPLPVFHTIHHAILSSTVVSSARDIFDTVTPTHSFPGEQSWPAIINNDWHGDVEARQTEFAQRSLWRVDDLEEGLCRPEMWFPEEDPEVWSLLQAVEELPYEDSTTSDLAASDDASAALKPFVLHLHVLSTGNDPTKTQRFIDTLLSTTDGLPSHSRNWTVSLQFLVHPIPDVHSNQDASSRLSTTLSSLSSFTWLHGSKMVFMGSNRTSPDTYLMNPANVWEPQHGNEALLLTTDDVEWHDEWAEWLRDVVETRWLCYRSDKSEQLQEVKPTCQYDSRAYGIALSVEDAGRQVLRYYGALEDKEPSPDSLFQVQAWSPHAQIFFPYAWMRFTRFVEQMREAENDEGRFPLFPGTTLPEVEVVVAGNSEEDQVERWVRERRRVSRLDAVSKMSVAAGRDDVGTWYTLFAAFVGRNGLHAFAPAVDLVSSTEGSTAMGLLTIDDPRTEVPAMHPHARATSKPELNETVYDFQWRPTQPKDTPLQMREWAMQWVTWKDVQKRVKVVREWRLNPTKNPAKTRAVKGEEYEDYEVDVWWWTEFSTWVVMMACMTIVAAGFAVAWCCHGWRVETARHEKGDGEKRDCEKDEVELGLSEKWQKS